MIYPSTQMLALIYPPVLPVRLQQLQISDPSVCIASWQLLKVVGPSQPTHEYLTLCSCALLSLFPYFWQHTAMFKWVNDSVANMSVEENPFFIVACERCNSARPNIKERDKFIYLLFSRWWDNPWPWFFPVFATHKCFHKTITADVQWPGKRLNTELKWIQACGRLKTSWAILLFLFICLHQWRETLSTRCGWSIDA